MSWYFYVDTSVKFWDGSTLTAADASYSLQRAMHSPQFKTRFQCVFGVSAMDESLFIVTLNYPDMQFPALLDIPVIKNGTIEDYAPMGTGPYMPDEQYTKLTAFPDYRNYAKLPTDTIYLKEIKETEDIITAFENSEIDLVTNDPTGVYSLGYGSANEIRSCPTTNMHYLGFRSSSRFFSN
jgi:ABC-type transport system substrate-binding protein